MKEKGDIASSEAARQLQALRKNKRGGFSNPETARQAGLKGAAARWKGHVKASEKKGSDEVGDSRQRPEPEER